MNKTTFKLSPSVKQALLQKRPVVALESTILAHGMPFPQNLDFAIEGERIAKNKGIVPATIAIIKGCIHIGLDEKEMELVCKSSSFEKISLRDLAWGTSKNVNGATTVSATMFLAHAAGIHVFATGGIGGVHREANLSFDVSQDLLALSKIPMIVISAGAKAILDLAKTLETLETLSVPVLGYKTNEFPGFYSRRSGLKLNMKTNSVNEIVSIYKHQINMKLQTAILVANPVPKKDEIPKPEMDLVIERALIEAKNNGVTGKEITPFLLKNIVTQTKGRSLKTNISLALNNIKLASEIGNQM